MTQTWSASAQLGLFLSWQCSTCARPFECFWRFDPGADIGLPAENLSSSLSTTCLKFLSFEKVWNWWQTQVIGPQAASPTRALNEANLLRSNRADWSAKHSIEAKEPRTKKVTKTLLVYQRGAFHKPLWVIFRTFMPCLTSVLWSKPGRSNGVCLTYGLYRKQCHDPHSYPAYSVQ